MVNGSARLTNVMLETQQAELQAVRLSEVCSRYVECRPAGRGPHEVGGREELWEQIASLCKHFLGPAFSWPPQQLDTSSLVRQDNKRLRVRSTAFVVVVALPDGWLRSSVVSVGFGAKKI